MKNSFSESYKNAGVDVTAGYKAVELMKEHVKKTMREEVLGGLGGFAGAFSLAKIKEMAYAGGSSNVLRKALKAAAESI